MIRILYIVYVWLVMVPIFLFLTLLTALTTIVGCLLGSQRFFSYYPGKIWSWLTCHLALCPVRIKGREHLQPKQSYVFVANHQGAFDIFLIYGFLGVPIKWVMKAGIGKIPFVGAACRAAGFIFVDHSTPRAAARSIREAERCLKDGSSVVVFPEGSRSRNGKIQRFKKGAFQMAADQHLPIAPITLNGPYDVLKGGSLNLHRGPMELVIHEPIPAEEMEPGHQGLQQMADRTKAIISESLWEQYK